MSALVTIGVCVKNAEKTIRESIISIINQRYPTKLIRLIIVDGCSKDRTLPIVASTTSTTDIKVEIYSDKGRGLGAARQIAADHADGKYMIFVDADVRLLDDFIANHVEFMEKNHNVGIAFGKPMHQQGTLVSTVWDLHNYATGGYLGCHATVYRSEALRQTGGFDENIKGASEDRDLTTRIQAKGWSVSVNEKARFFHKCRENLKGFWEEQSWFGYGDHYINHKNRNTEPYWHRLPFGSFIHGLGKASRAYELTHLKASFFIPPQMVLGNIAWWFGFVKGHIDGYGHEIH
jgi:glycosyltransferase involved in cell wall biosynthesis